MGAPRTIGPYEIVRLLDAGGMGRVYLAREREGVAAGRLVVVKTIRSELERSPEHVASFQREARVLAHIRHPNVVQLFDAGTSGHRLYMAMEYLEGLDASKVLKLLSNEGRKLPVEVALHIGREVALALDAAHAWRGPDGPSGLVHRDLSPHNVLLLYGGGVKLLDFGLARTYGETSTTRTGMVKGKFRYLAPEQARGETLDARVDLFTLGLVMFEMITGKRGYDQVGDMDVLRAAMAGDVPLLSTIAPEVPEAVAKVIERAMSPDLAVRHPSAIALAEDLAHVAVETGLTADALTLRRFMEEVRVLAENAPPPAVPKGEESVSGEYLGASQIASVADVSGRPPPTPRRKAQRRTWAAAALAAIGVASLAGAIAVSRRPAPAGAAPSPSAPAAMVSAPATPASSASEALPPPSASVSPSASPAPPSRPAAATTPAPAGAKDRRVVKPKRGVGTGVVADYP